MFYSDKAPSKAKVLISTVRGLAKIDQSKHDRDWYLLGDDYRLYFKLKKRFSNLELPKSAIQNISTSTYREYLDYSHRTNQLNDFPIYWSCILASRNTTTFPAFRYLVYLIFARARIESSAHERDTGFIVTDPLLGSWLSEFCFDHNHSHIFIRSIADRCHPLLTIVKILIRPLLFLSKASLLHIYAKGLSKSNALRTQQNHFFLRSWITSGSFLDNGHYRDRNFGDLRSFLESKGFTVTIMPLYFNMKESKFRTLKRVSAASEPILIQEHHLLWWDYLSIIFQCIKLLSVKMPKDSIQGFKMGKISKSLHLRTCFMPIELNYNLVFQLTKRLNKKGIAISHIAYPLENNSPEKILLKAFRRHYPKTHIIGVQHAVWYQRQFGMHLLPEEIPYHPLPDQVVCTGRAYYKIMKDCGFPENILSQGPNLRFRVAKQGAGRQMNRRILIILTTDDSEMMELLIRCKNALESFQDLPPVWIKAHPETSRNCLISLLEEIDFPKYQFAAGTVQELSKQCNAVVMAPTSVSNLEVIAMGIPLVRISLHSLFNTEPIWDEASRYPTCDKNSELVASIARAFEPGESFDEQLLEQGQQITNMYFNPIDDPSGHRLIDVYLDHPIG